MRGRFRVADVAAFDQHNNDHEGKQDQPRDHPSGKGLGDRNISQRAEQYRGV